MIEVIRSTVSNILGLMKRTGGSFNKKEAVTVTVKKEVAVLIFQTP